MLGGAKALAGKSETIKDAIVWLYAQAVTDRNIEGNKRCAGWGYLIRPDGGSRQKVRVEIPNWMQGLPATRLDGKDKYNYIQLVQKYCSQFLYLPPSTQKLQEETPSTPIDTDGVKITVVALHRRWRMERVRRSALWAQLLVTQIRYDLGDRLPFGVWVSVL